MRIDLERFCQTEEYAYMLRLDGKWVYLGGDVGNSLILDEYAG